MSAEKRIKVSLIIPVHNEQENIDAMCERLKNVFVECTAYDFEVLFVDDGSKDKTLEKINQHISADAPFGYVKLSRNFGHQPALEAGMATATGEAIITLDGDLQHPPEYIPAMIEQYVNGAEVVQMQRDNVADTSNNTLSYLFHQFFTRISKAPIVPHAADFRLISSVVRDHLISIPGRGKIYRAIIPALGFKQVILPYKQAVRERGTPSYHLFSRLELALTIIFKFSKFPAYFTTISGLLLSATGILLFVLSACNIMPQSLLSIGIISVIALSGVLLMATGVLCWYFVFVMEQQANTPLFIVEEVKR